MSGGLQQSAINTLRYNRKILKNSKVRYSKVKEQYIGTGYHTDDSKPFPTLTPQELTEGRKRAEAFYRKRNRNLYFTIALSFLAAIGLVALIIWFLLG